MDKAQTIRRRGRRTAIAARSAHAGRGDETAPAIIPLSRDDEPLAAPAEPVRVPDCGADDVGELLRLANELRRLQERIDARAELVLRRMNEAGVYQLAAGPHDVEVVLERDALRRTRKRALVVNGSPVYMQVSRTRPLGSRR